MDINEGTLHLFGRGSTLFKLLILARRVIATLILHDVDIPLDTSNINRSLIQTLVVLFVVFWMNDFKFSAFRTKSELTNFHAPATNLRA